MGTNGHALYYYKIEAPEAWHNKYSFAYHRRDVAKICTYLTKIKSDTALSFKLFELKGKRTFWTKIDNKYVLEKGIRPEDECILTEHTDKKGRHMPDYLSVISKEWNRELNIHDRQAFAKQLKEEVKNNKHLKLAFLLNKKGTKLKRVKSFSIDMQTTFEMPQHTYKGDPLDIGCNAEYFLKIIEAYKEGLCQIKFYNECRAFGIINPHEVYIMMPIMLALGDDDDDDDE